MANIANTLQPHRPSPIAVLIERAEARAFLVSAGAMDKIQAVDELWASAETTGLIAELGVDKVQSLLAEAFNIC